LKIDPLGVVLGLWLFIFGLLAVEPLGDWLQLMEAGAGSYKPLLIPVSLTRDC